MHFPKIRCLAALVTALLGSAATAQPTVDNVRLYALDCGHFETTDLGRLSDTFEHAGEKATRVSPCWLIRHPKGNLLWDLGLGDRYATLPDGFVMGSMLRLFVPVTLSSQLQALGLQPSDIGYVAVSHLHIDHMGNAPLVASATWLMNRRELEAAQRNPPPTFLDQAQIDVVRKAKTVLYSDDYDVFGDGSVRLLKAPGHTAGSQVLMLKLQNAGPVILSGDLFHSREAAQKSFIPGSNDSRADPLASMDRIRKIIQSTRARLVIHHDPEDFAAMPKFPAYLD